MPLPPPPQSAGGNGNFDPSRIFDEGTHLANIISIIDIGQQPNRFKNDGSTSYKVLITFESMNDTYSYEKDGDEVVLKKVVSKDCSYSYAEKAFLTATVQAGLGRKLTKLEKGNDEFLDPSCVLGKPVMITVTKTANKTNPEIQYANVGSVVQPLKGMAYVNPERDLVTFSIRQNPTTQNAFLSLEELENDTTWTKLNNFVKGKIKESIEYLELEDLAKVATTTSQGVDIGQSSGAKQHPDEFYRNQEDAQSVD